MAGEMQDDGVNDLIRNLDRLHTTALGLERIRKNLCLEEKDVVDWCRERIKRAGSIVRTGKNWYVRTDRGVLTVNAHSYTLITAHRTKEQAE